MGISGLGASPSPTRSSLSASGRSTCAVASLMCTVTSPTSRKCPMELILLSAWWKPTKPTGTSIPISGRLWRRNLERICLVTWTVTVRPTSISLSWFYSLFFSWLADKSEIIAKFALSSEFCLLHSINQVKSMTHWFPGNCLLSRVLWDLCIVV